MKQMKGFFAGILVMMILLSALKVQGADVMTSISVYLNKANISVDGKVVGKANTEYALTDGSLVPFSITYKGTTYLPIRKVAELLGKDVYWDASTNTAGVKEATSTTIPVTAPTQQPPASTKPQTGSSVVIDGKTYNLTGATVADLGGKYYYVMLNDGGTGVPFLSDTTGHKYIYSVGVAYCITELLEKRFAITSNTIDSNPLISGIIKIDRKYYWEQVITREENIIVGDQTINSKTVTATYKNGMKLSEKHIGNEVIYEPADLFTQITPIKLYESDQNYLIDLDELCNRLELPKLSVTYNPTLKKNVVDLNF